MKSINNICRLERDKSNLTNWSKLRIEKNVQMQKLEKIIQRDEYSSTTDKMIHRIKKDKTKYIQINKNLIYAQSDGGLCEGRMTELAYNLSILMYLDYYIKY